MDRNKYLELCREIAIFKGNQNKAVFEIPEKFIIYYNNLKFYPKSYELWFDEKGTPCHTAIIQDLNKNSVVYVDLNKISVDKIK